MDTWKERMIIRLLSAKYRLISKISTRKAGSGSVDVLIYPMQGRIVPKLDPKHSVPSTIKTESADQLKVSLYDWHKPGDTTLLVHGWDSNTYRWYPLIHHLEDENLHFVALDAPNHGESGGDHFNMVHFANMIDVAIEKFNPVNIVAHSIGALALAYYLQKKNYQKLKNLILLCPVADLSWHIDRYHQLLSLPAKTRDAMDSYFEDFFKMKFSDFNFRDFEKEMNCDITIIHDKNDPVVPLSDSQKINEWFVGSELKVIEGHGHRLQHVEVFDMIKEILT